MYRTIFRNISQRKIQVVSIALSIALCTATLMTLFLLHGGLSQGIALSEERSGAQLLVIPEDAEDQLEKSDFLFTGAPVGAYMPESLADEIKNVEGVKRITVQFYGQTLMESCCTTTGATRIIGFDPRTDWVVSPYCVNDISSGLSDDEIVLGCNVTGYESGCGKVLGHDVRVASALEPTGTYLDNSILMNIDVIRSYSSAEGTFDHYWKKYGEPSTVASAILVETEDGDQDAVAAKIKRKVDGDFSVVVRSEVIADAQETLTISFTVMLVTVVALALTSLLQLVSRFYSLVWERKAELALYRALGARVMDLRVIICGEALCIALAGIVVGLVLGGIAYVVAYGMLQSVSAFPFEALGAGQIVLGIVAIALLLVAMTLISIITPLHQVARIDPASAMQQLDIG